MPSAARQDVREPDLAIHAANISKTFGGVKAVSNVTLTVERDSLHSVIGPNGAGKTTLFNLLSGTLAPSSGDVFLNGRLVTGMPLGKLVHMGVGRSFQTTSLFPELTVRENIRIAAYASTMPSLRSSLQKVSANRRVNADVEIVLARISMSEQAHITVRALSHGNRRKVELGLLLAQKADVVLLDEPTAGLAAEEIPTLLDIISGFRKESKTVVLVEHNMKVVMNVSDKISVMSQGELLTQGTPKEIAANEMVQNIYLGKRREGLV